MATIYLSGEAIENLFRSVVLAILNLPDTDNKSVRFPYGSTADTGSAPGITRKENVCFIYVNPADDGYGQQRHISYQPEEGSDLLTHVDEHTEIYKVTFVCYGPDAFEWARRIMNGLYRNDIRLLLKQSSFFLKVGIPPIVQLREVREGEWWIRYDVSPTFYSYVRIETPDIMDTIESANVTSLH